MQTKVVGTGTHNAARRMMEALTVTADVVTSASAKPARFIADWTTDKIAPDYWVPNALITVSSTSGSVFSLSLNSIY